MLDGIQTVIRLHLAHFISIVGGNIWRPGTCKLLMRNQEKDGFEKLELNSTAINIPVGAQESVSDHRLGCSVTHHFFCLSTPLNLE